MHGESLHELTVNSVLCPLSSITLRQDIGLSLPTRSNHWHLLFDPGKRDALTHEKIYSFLKKHCINFPHQIFRIGFDLQKERGFDLPDKGPNCLTLCWQYDLGNSAVEPVLTVCNFDPYDIRFESFIKSDQVYSMLTPEQADYLGGVAARIAIYVYNHK